MCELFGYSGCDTEPITEYLNEFYSHSIRHPHGWGLAALKNGRMNVEKEPMQAQKSAYLRRRLQAGIRSSLALAHIRYATIGTLSHVNCHPFSGIDQRGVEWTMIHNGTIFDYETLKPYVKMQRGETDSECILLYWLDLINEAYQTYGRSLRQQEINDLLEQMIWKMAKNNKLNLILTDGKSLYVHCNFKNSLYYVQTREFSMVATTPLEMNQLPWEQIPERRLLVFRDEKLIYQGKEHPYEYIATEAQLKYLYLAYANL